MAGCSETIRRSSICPLPKRAILKYFVAFVVLIHGYIPVFAQSPLDKLLEQNRVEALITLGLQNIHRGKCGREGFCDPASPEELKSPPVSVKQAREAVKAGINSAILKWCGLQWAKRSFAPCMYHNRHVAKLDERQLGLLALLHGIQQGMLFSTLSQDQGVCPDQMKQRFTERLPYRVQSQ